MATSPLIQLRLHVAIDSSDPQQMQKYLFHYLDVLAYANVEYLRQNKVPALYDAGVRYRREGFKEEWLQIPFILKRKHGDCEDLAAWRVAELRYSGVYAEFRLTKQRNVWHVTLTHSGGVIEDPSKRLGM